MNATWAFEEPEPVICMFYNPDFILYSSLGSFYIPCLIMIVLYTRIFKVGVMKFSKVLSSDNNVIDALDSARPRPPEQVSLRSLPRVSALRHGHPASRALSQGQLDSH